jgi:hypothetical protein
MARWVDYYLGRQGGPRAHPTGQPDAMAPQRRGAVAAPSRDPTRQATLPRGRPRQRLRGGRHRGTNHSRRLRSGSTESSLRERRPLPRDIAGGRPAGGTWLLSSPRPRLAGGGSAGRRHHHGFSAEPEKPLTRRAASITAQPRLGRCSAMAPPAGRGTDAAPGRKISGGCLDVRG